MAYTWKKVVNDTPIRYNPLSGDVTVEGGSYYSLVAVNTDANSDSRKYGYTEKRIDFYSNKDDNKLDGDVVQVLIEATDSYIEGKKLTYILENHDPGDSGTAEVQGNPVIWEADSSTGNLKWWWEDSATGEKDGEIAVFLTFYEDILDCCVTYFDIPEGGGSDAEDPFVGYEKIGGLIYHRGIENLGSTEINLVGANKLDLNYGDNSVGTIHIKGKLGYEPTNTVKITVSSINYSGQFDKTINVTTNEFDEVFVVQGTPLGEPSAIWISSNKPVGYVEAFVSENEGGGGSATIYEGYEKLGGVLHHFGSKDVSSYTDLQITGGTAANVRNYAAAHLGVLHIRGKLSGSDSSASISVNMYDGTSHNENSISISGNEFETAALMTFVPSSSARYRIYCSKNLDWIETWIDEVPYNAAPPDLTISMDDSYYAYRSSITGSSSSVTIKSGLTNLDSASLALKKDASDTMYLRLRDNNGHSIQITGDTTGSVHAYTKTDIYTTNGLVDPLTIEYYAASGQNPKNVSMMAEWIRDSIEETVDHKYAAEWDAVSVGGDVTPYDSSSYVMNKTSEVIAKGTNERDTNLKNITIGVISDKGEEGFNSIISKHTGDVIEGAYANGATDPNARSASLTSDFTELVPGELYIATGKNLSSNNASYIMAIYNPDYGVYGLYMERQSYKSYAYSDYAEWRSDITSSSRCGFSTQLATDSTVSEVWYNPNEKAVCVIPTMSTQQTHEYVDIYGYHKNEFINQLPEGNVDIDTVPIKGTHVGIKADTVSYNYSIIDEYYAYLSELLPPPPEFSWDDIMDATNTLFPSDEITPVVEDNMLRGYAKDVIVHDPDGPIIELTSGRRFETKDALREYVGSGACPIPRGARVTVKIKFNVAPYESGGSYTLPRFSLETQWLSSELRHNMIVDAVSKYHFNSESCDAAGKAYALEGSFTLTAADGSHYAVFFLDSYTGSQGHDPVIFSDVLWEISWTTS